MNTIIYDLWEEIINYGYEIRKNNKDGKVGWDTIKVLIPDLKITWLDKPKNFHDKLVELGVNKSETPEEAVMSKAQWERHHYLLQHGRIVKNNEDGNLQRLLQIAYNAGQFKAELEKETYPVEQLKYYIINELNKVTTYIEKIGEIPADVMQKLKDAFQAKEPVSEAMVTSETPAKIASYINFSYHGGGTQEPKYKHYLREYITKLKY